MITFSDLTFCYDESDQASICHFSRQIKSGECIVITGKSGCGKTTLSRLVNGLIPELYEGELQGSCEVAGLANPGSPIYQLSENVGSVFQNPKTQFFTTDVLSELAFACENMGRPQAEIAARIKEVAEMFQITHLLERDMFSLSGGEKQLIAIASAYMPNPKLLVLDEPSSNLDFSTIDHLGKILTALKQAGVTLMIVEHRLYYLKEVADQFLIIQQGKLLQSCSQEAMQRMSEAEREKLGLRSVLLEHELQQIAAASTIQVDVPKKLSVDALTVHYPKVKTAAVAVDQLTLYQQQVVGIMGKNGAGKSSFVKALCGLLKSTSGKFTFAGESISAAGMIEKSFLVFQDVNYQLFCETVEKELLLKAKRVQDFEKVVRVLNLEDLLLRHPATLSGGEKQRVAIGSAILSGKELLVFDEPTSGLDFYHMKQVTQMIRYLQTLGVFVITISHDLEFICQTCQRVILLEQGQIKADLPMNQSTLTDLLKWL